MKKKLFIAALIIVTFSGCQVAAREEIPGTLPEFLEWLSGTGAGILFPLILSALGGVFPKLKSWYGGLAPKQGQALIMVGSAVLSLGAFFGQAAFGLVPLPQAPLEWGNLIFAHVVAPLFAGVGLQTVIYVTPKLQSAWVRAKR